MRPSGTLTGSGVAADGNETLGVDGSTTGFGGGGGAATFGFSGVFSSTFTFASAVADTGAGVAAGPAIGGVAVSASGTTGEVTAFDAPADGGDALASSASFFFCSVVSMVDGARLIVASAARAIESPTNRIARIVVVRVRKSAAPRADINPPGLPPVNPPPSERCIKITAVIATAMMR